MIPMMVADTIPRYDPEIRDTMPLRESNAQLAKKEKGGTVFAHRSITPVVS
jgi:hypothetical protein